MHTEVVLNPGDQQMTTRYTTPRNELTSALKNAKFKHYSDDLIELDKSDLHKTWGVLRVIIGNYANNTMLHVEIVNFFKITLVVANLCNLRFSAVLLVFI